MIGPHQTIDPIGGIVGSIEEEEGGGGEWWW